MILFNKKNNKNIFDLEIKNNVPFLVFRDLKEYANIGFSTRIGGVSKGIYSSMNLGVNRGDNLELVKKNFEIILSSLNLNKKYLYISNQTHSTNIKIVKKEDKKPFLYVPNESIDGLITGEKDIVLATFYADCIPIFFVDKNKTCIGMCHAGWRGSINKIAEKLLKTMIDAFKVDVKNILVGIGPAICMECYEIGDELAKNIKNLFPIYKNILHFLNDKWHLDLWELNKLILLENGILEENIFITNLCTFENSDLLFSHRKTNGKHGNMGAFISMK